MTILVVCSPDVAFGDRLGERGAHDHLHLVPQCGGRVEAPAGGDQAEARTQAVGAAKITKTQRSI